MNKINDSHFILKDVMKMNKRKVLTMDANSKLNK